jgi:hypothetical protein
MPITEGNLEHLGAWRLAIFPASLPKMKRAEQLAFQNCKSACIVGCLHCSRFPMLFSTLPLISLIYLPNRP